MGKKHVAGEKKEREFRFWKKRALPETAGAFLAGIDEAAARALDGAGLTGHERAAALDSAIARDFAEKLAGVWAEPYEDALFARIWIDFLVDWTSSMVWRGVFEAERRRGLGENPAREKAERADKAFLRDVA